MRPPPVVGEEGLVVGMEMVEVVGQVLRRVEVVDVNEGVIGREVRKVSLAS